MASFHGLVQARGNGDAARGAGGIGCAPCNTGGKSGDRKPDEEVNACAGNCKLAIEAGLVLGGNDVVVQGDWASACSAGEFLRAPRSSSRPCAAEARSSEILCRSAASSNGSACKDIVACFASNCASSRITAVRSASARGALARQVVAAQSAAFASMSNSSRVSASRAADIAANVGAGGGANSESSEARPKGGGGTGVFIASSAVSVVWPLSSTLFWLAAATRFAFKLPSGKRDKPRAEAFSLPPPFAVADF